MPIVYNFNKFRQLANRECKKAVDADCWGKRIGQLEIDSLIDISSGLS